MADGLNIWTIYDHPSDYPEGYIARRWVVIDGLEKPTIVTITGPLEAMRLHFQSKGLVCLPRDPTDDPKIVECWI